MKTRFTLLMLVLTTGVPALAQRPGPVPGRARWQIPETISRRIIAEPRRLYVGFDLGYYRSIAGGADPGRLLRAFRLNRELFPGLTVGWALTRRVTLETGLYNLPSTTAYSIDLHQTSPGMGELGIQYAVVPLRVRYRVARPTRWLSAYVHAGVAMAFNNRIRKGKFERINLVYPPVLGDTVAVVNEGEMIHNVSLLLEAGAELRADLGHNVAVVLYGRGVLGLQPFWRNDIRYQINQQEPPGHLTMTARANGLTFGLGLRYTFNLGNRYRTIWQ